MNSVALRRIFFTGFQQIKTTVGLNKIILLHDVNYSVKVCELMLYIFLSFHLEKVYGQEKMSVNRPRESIFTVFELRNCFFEACSVFNFQKKMAVFFQCKV